MTYQEMKREARKTAGKGPMELYDYTYDKCMENLINKEIQARVNKATKQYTDKTQPSL